MSPVQHPVYRQETMVSTKNSFTIRSKESFQFLGEFPVIVVFLRWNVRPRSRTASLGTPFRLWPLHSVKLFVTKSTYCLQVQSSSSQSGRRINRYMILVENKPRGGITVNILFAFTSSGEDACLMDGAELGESRECSSFQDACETLAIGMFYLKLIRWYLRNLI